MTAPQEGAITKMSIPDRQRDPRTGRFVDSDPTDRPTRPTAAQARKLYAELDALKAKIAAQAGQLEDAANLAKSRLETLQKRDAEIRRLKTRIEQLQTSEANVTTNLGLAREDAERAEQSARDWEAIDNRRQAEIKELARDKALLEALVADYKNAVLREERVGQSAALVGICITAVFCTFVGWLLRHFAEVWGWIHG